MQTFLLRGRYKNTGKASEIKTTISPSRLKCSFEKRNIELFFSLVDYRNGLFMSNNPNDIMKFYDTFDTRRELIEWMRERPKGAAHIHEVEGHKDVIVVIPTSNFNGKFATECRENIFNGLHIIFVESGGKGDFYFNIAHNLNVGIKRALEYDPRWIVVTNDDVIKKDETTVLVNELSRIDHKITRVVFITPSRYHSQHVFFGRQNKLRELIFKLTAERRFQLIVERKFEVKLFSSMICGYGLIFFRHDFSHISIGNFGIFSPIFLREKNGDLFDETYINGGEDVDLSLEVAFCGCDVRFIRYEIGDIVGGTLGRGKIRKLRDVAGYTYLNNKIKNGNHQASAQIIEVISDWKCIEP